MGKLPHYENSQSAMEQAEAVTNNLFEMTIQPPNGIQVPKTLTEEIFSISGLDILDSSPEISRQLAKGHTRLHSQVFLEDTTLPIEVVINLNLHGRDADQNIIYNMFKEWQRVKRNEKNGASSLKYKQTGKFIIKQTNVEGFVWRMIEASVVFIGNITGFDEQSIESGEPVQLTVQLHAEQYKVTP